MMEMMAMNINRNCGLVGGRLTLIPMRTRPWSLVLVALCVLPLSGSVPLQPSEFSLFVDNYLDAFARRHPSIAAGNGIHTHDDLLEDMSGPGGAC